VVVTLLALTALIEDEVHHSAHLAYHLAGDSAGPIRRHDQDGDNATS